MYIYVTIIIIISLLFCIIPYNKETFIDKKNNVACIHIGKCGGTTIHYLLKNHLKNKNYKEYHMKRNYNHNETYIIWIRNPLNRFVSAFNHAMKIIQTDTNGLDLNNLDLNNLEVGDCLDPNRLKHKSLHGYAYTKRYDYLIQQFKTANHLAESITSEDKHERMLALELMNSKEEHIHKGIGWYLYNGDFVDQNYTKIHFVGSIENMNTDTNTLSKMFNLDHTNIPHIHKNKSQQDTFLSDKAINNLIEYYKDTDYRALQKLVQYNLISKELLDTYYTP